MSKISKLKGIVVATIFVWGIGDNKLIIGVTLNIFHLITFYIY